MVVVHEKVKTINLDLGLHGRCCGADHMPFSMRPSFPQLQGTLAAVCPGRAILQKQPLAEGSCFTQYNAPPPTPRAS